MSGPALHAGAQVDQLSDLRLDDLDTLVHRQRVVPAGGIKVEVQPVLARLRPRRPSPRRRGCSRSPTPATGSRTPGSSAASTSPTPDGGPRSAPPSTGSSPPSSSSRSPPEFTFTS
jgi:hypothetical protein